MTDILFVCLGNICRSPLMEGVVRARWQASAGQAKISFDSAGIGDWHAGQPPDHRAIATAHRHGIDIAGQRARALEDSDFQRFDLILCADRDILRVLRQRRPADSRAECALFLDWTGVGNNGEIPDPYAGNQGDFEAAFVLIDTGAAGFIKRFQAGP